MVRRESLLLGAGVSIYAGIPDSNALFTKLLSSDDLIATYATEFGAMSDEFTTRYGPNPEKLLEAVSVLLHRSRGYSSQGNYDHRFTSFLESHLDKERLENTFIRMMNKFQQLVWIDQFADLEYLTPLIRYVAKKGSNSTRIFSLNFDNTIEVAANKSNISCMSMPGLGDFGWWVSRTLAGQEPDVMLCKLFGSPDWRLSPNLKHHNELNQTLTTVLPKPEAWSKETNLNSVGLSFLGTTTGALVEYSQFERFGEWLLNSKKLTIIGYSFRNKDVNYLLENISAKNQNLTNITVVARNPKEEQVREIFLAKNVRFVKKTATTAIEELFQHG